MVSHRWGAKDEATQTFPTQEMVKEVREALQSAGHRVWMDIDYMRGEMDDVMFDVVESCAVFVACVTPDYFEDSDSNNALKEFEHALAARKPGVDMVVAKLDPAMDMAPVEQDFGQRAAGHVAATAFNLTASGSGLHEAVVAMASKVNAFRSARRVYLETEDLGLYDGVSLRCTRLLAGRGRRHSGPQSAKSTLLSIR